MDSDDEVRLVIDWVQSTSAPVLASDLVPGATRAQRTSLAAAGGLVGSLVSQRRLGDWPEAVQAWVSASPTPPNRVVDALQRALHDDTEVFATIYCALVAGENRRRLGTFFTPRPVVNFMLDKVVRPSGACTLVDPGAGVGAFALAAALKWPDMTVTAVDVNVVTLGFLGAAIEQAAVGNVQLVHADYLTWMLDDRQVSEPRLLVGNPPYTRHQELDRKAKTVMVEASHELVSSRLAGLSAYFLAASFSSMAPEDSLCFVLPSTWTEARYGRELRSWLWSESERTVEMHVFPADAGIFPGTRVSAMVLYVGPRGRSTRAFSRHRATLSDERVTATAVKRTDRIGEVPRSLGPWLWQQQRVDSADRVPLGELASVRRGVATGANFFFFLTDEEAEGVPEGALLPALRRLRHVRGDVLNRAEHRRIGADGKPRWLLALDDPVVVARPEVQRLLDVGQHAGVPERYLSRVRDPWYVLEHVDPPHLLVAAMAKDRLRVVRNTVRAVHSNSMYGIYLRRPALSNTLSVWLNGDEGQAAMFAQTRHYSEGLKKLEPRDLLSVLVPDFSADPRH